MERSLSERCWLPKILSRPGRPSHKNFSYPIRWLGNCQFIAEAGLPIGAVPGEPGLNYSLTMRAARLSSRGAARRAMRRLPLPISDKMASFATGPARRLPRRREQRRSLIQTR